jgi:hypothetical protein
LKLTDFNRSAAFFVIVGHTIDPGAHGIAQHRALGSAVRTLKRAVFPGTNTNDQFCSGRGSLMVPERISSMPSLSKWINALLGVISRSVSLASFYDAPRLQAFFRCIPSVLPGDRLPAPSMPEAVSYCADLALGRQRRVPCRWTPYKLQGADVPL